MKIKVMHDVEIKENNVLGNEPYLNKYIENWTDNLLNMFEMLNAAAFNISNEKINLNDELIKTRTEYSKFNTKGNWFNKFVKGVCVLVTIARVKELGMNEMAKSKFEEIFKFMAEFPKCTAPKDKYIELLMYANREFA
jgi:hypothetical protein